MGSFCLLNSVCFQEYYPKITLLQPAKWCLAMVIVAKPSCRDTHLTTWVLLRFWNSEFECAPFACFLKEKYLSKLWATLSQETEILRKYYCQFRVWANPSHSETILSHPLYNSEATLRITIYFGKNLQKLLSSLRKQVTRSFVLDLLLSTTYISIAPFLQTLTACSEDFQWKALAGTDFC